jgi:glycosyltransferase involved in cell wall biosynthesis
MRVLYIIDHLGVGGAQHSVKNIAENAERYGIEPLVCALRVVEPAVAIKAPTKILQYSRYDVRALQGIIQVCRTYKPDIIHTQLSKSHLLGILAGKWCGIPVVVHERGDIFIKGRTFNIYRMLFRIVGRMATLIIANSQATAGYLMTRRRLRNKIRMLPNAIDTVTLNVETVCKKKVRTQLGLDPAACVVGYVGRLHAMKGVDILIDAFSIIASRYPDAVLVIAGDGPDRAQLEDQVRSWGLAGRVKFLGMVDNVPEVMAAFDIGVVPSRQESFGRVAIELMHMRVPVVSSGYDGLAELVQHEKTGLVTETNTPEHIAAAVERLINDKQVQKILVENAYVFSGQFGIDEYIKKLGQIYTELLEKRA